MGDTVQIVESHPISKEVRWVVEAVLNRGYHVELPVDEPPWPPPRRPPL